MNTVSRFAFLVMSSACIIAIFGCGEANVLREVPSPDGSVVARYYYISGGGAAGWIDEYVSVDSAGAPFDPFDGTPVLTMSHAGDAELTWVDNRHLKVEIGEWANVKWHCSMAAGVRIDYVILSEARESWSQAARARSEERVRAKRRGEVDPVADRRGSEKCLPPKH